MYDKSKFLNVDDYNEFITHIKGEAKTDRQKLIAEVISGTANRLAPFDVVPKQKTFGGLGKTAAEAYYRMIQGKDRLKEFLA